MDPYGTFGAERGIKAPAQAIPTPSVSTPRPAAANTVDQWQYSNPNPGVSRFTPVQDPSAKVTRYPGTQVSPVNLNDGRYDNTWMGYMGDQPEGGEVGHVGTGHYLDEYNRSVASMTRGTDRAAGGGGGRSGGGSYAPAQRTIKPMEAMKAPELPKYEGIGEYTPPEEDEGVYRQARREAMGPGMRALREGTREAISSAQSLDNPNARAKFIQQSLKGYGQGLESVAAGASKEGRTEARFKRQEQLDIYKTNYDIKSNTYLVNYQNQINTIAANFASEQSAQTANFNAGMDPNVTVGGGGSDTPAGRAKDEFYGGNVPNMGYMA